MTSRLSATRTLMWFLAVILSSSILLGQQRKPQPWMNKSLSPGARADLLVRQMTLNEKIELVHGVLSWRRINGHLRITPGSLGGDGYVPGIPRLGIPAQQQIGAGVGVTNGRAGDRWVRTNGASVALPSSLAETATWDPRMAYEFGSVIGWETRDEGFDVSLGGGIDLARNPRDGRNFEYHGEDPLLAGTILAQELRAIQAHHVVATVKHFAVNDQEDGRGFVSSNLDRRALRETDLLAFQIAIKESNAGAVMCAYNRVNGVYSCQNSYLLNDVLKDDWGFKGWVMSDWGANHSTVKAALAGLDQEMPSGSHFGNALKEAVQRRFVGNTLFYSRVPMSRLNNMDHRILRSLFAVGVFDHPPVVKPISVAADEAVAQRVEEQGAVLLKNARGVLPLGSSTVRSIAVIGSHANVGVLSGAGSAQVDPVGGNALSPKEGSHREVWDPSSPLKAIRALVPKATVRYNAGADVASAAKLAASSQVALVFVNQWTHEGADLPNLSLPGNQDELIRRVAAANPRTIIVLECGDPVLMPWLGRVSAVLESWYPGQRGGQAIANLLFGKVDPSGKLPITFPKSESQLPRVHEQGPTGGGYFDVDYYEGLKVGYKWYEAKHINPLFPFGFGLSYTRFSFSNIKLTPTSTDGANTIKVSFDLKNIGARSGAEVAQVYLGLPASTDEPPKRLVGWDKVDLEPGQVRRVTVTINPESAAHPLSFWSVKTHRWKIAKGDYTVYVGDSSLDIHLSGHVRVR